MTDGRAGARQPFAANRRRPSLALVLTAWYALTSFALVLAACWLLYVALERSLSAENDRLLSDRVAQVRDFITTSNATTGLLEEVNRSSSPRQHVPLFNRVLDGDGKLIVESPGMALLVPQSAFPARTDVVARDHSTVVRGDDDHLFQLLTAHANPPPDSTRPGPFIVQVALPLAPQETLLEKYRRRLWITLSIAFVLCIVVGYEIARRGIRPIENVTNLATRIRSTTLDARIDSRAMPAEIQSLAAEFNLMLDRLQESFARISRFSADIAHELRTPVTNLRGVAEVALTKGRSRDEYHDALSSTIEESMRLSHIIENLLFLARAEDPKHQIVREPLDIAKELTGVAEFYEPSAGEADVTIKLNIPEPISASVNRTLFQRAVGNLLDNAIKHTPAGGEITLAASRSNGSLRIEVSDTGRGIAPEHLPRVFDRLYRVADDRNKNTGGAGLGLAIVKSIAASHGGTVEMQSEERKGTRVAIIIPSPAT